MELEIEIAGDIVERQELLNGTQIVTLEGASGDGEWVLNGGLSWNVGLADIAPEGDITLTRSDAAEIFATLTGGTVSETDESAEAEYNVSLTYEIDGGSREFEASRGKLEMRGALAGEGFRVRLRASIAVG